MEAKPKFWTSDQTLLMTIFAGPVGGCLFLSQNDRILGNVRRARLVLGAGFLLFIAFALLATILPEGVPHFFIPLSYAILIQAYARSIEQKEISPLWKEGALKNSYKRASLYALIGIAINLALLFLIY